MTASTELLHVKYLLQCLWPLFKFCGEFENIMNIVFPVLNVNHLNFHSLFVVCASVNVPALLYHYCPLDFRFYLDLKGLARCHL